MSRLVLGGASFGKIPQSGVDLLLHTAYESGIRKIDTAPGYGDSEKRIGNFLKGKSIFTINSKVGMPDPSLFTPVGIRCSVEGSLRDLGVEQIGTLFIHSLDKSYLTYENISALVQLKDEGKIARIGYSGDGDNLNAALRANAFDDFMMTFNIIDQSNSEFLSAIHANQEIYFKIPLAQGIWRSLKFDRRVASLRFIRGAFNKPPLPDSWLEYRSRFIKFKSQIKSKDYAAEFLTFALFSGNGNQHVVLGTNSPVHIRDALHIEAQEPDLGQISSYRSLWEKRSLPNWQPHN